jgi:hypothetical protein
MKFRLVFFIILITTGYKVSAQNDADVLRYSFLNYGSTARSLGMGNSFGALGADFSTLSINPAGVAMYRRSEFTISPTFSNRNSESDFGGTITDDNHFKFAFGNFGFVFANREPRKNSDWKRITFGVGYNRTNNFSSNTLAEYANANNSLVDNYLETLAQDNTPPDQISNLYPFDVDLAWQTFLIDTAGGNYFSAIPFAGGLQRKITESRGGQGEWAFSVGGNYDDRLYIGATLGIPVVRYEEETTWSEEDEKDTIPFFESYRINSSLVTSGSGINFKVGAIYRVADFLRLGVAVHTPTWLVLTDDYRTDIRTDLEDGTIREWTSPDFIPFEYRITTPFRVIGSIAIIAGQAAAFNIDYEYLDYSQSKIKPTDSQFKSDFVPTNRAIRAKYGMQHNVRAGIELPYDAMRFRLGAEYSTSPFDSNLRPDDEETDLSRLTLTGGIGYRGEKFYLDAAYAYSKYGSLLYPYTLNNESTPFIKTVNSDHRIMFTTGWMF